MTIFGRSRKPAQPADPNTKACPYNGMIPCLEKGCALFVPLYTPQPDGKKVETWRCGVAWIPLLTVENTAAINRLGNLIEKATAKPADKNTH